MSNEAMSDRLIEQFNAVVGVTEELLQQMSSVGGDKAVALRDSVERNLALSKLSLRNLQQAATGKARAAAEATDAYVHAKPWQAMGMAAGFVVVMALVSELLVRRR